MGQCEYNCQAKERCLGAKCRCAGCQGGSRELGKHEFKGIKISMEQLRPINPDLTIDAGLVGGAFKKNAVTVDGVTYLVKDGTEYPDLTETELLSNRIASELNLPIATFGEFNVDGIKMIGGVDFTKSGAEPATLEHFDEHMAEFPIEWNCKSIIAKIEEQSSSPKEDVEAFIRLSILDSLIGNGDRHARNLALLKSENGTMRLSPFYDTVSGGYLLTKENLDLDLEGSIRTSSSEEPKLLDYIKEFKDLGYENVLRDISNDINEAAIIRLIKTSKMKKSRKEWFTTYITNQIKKLKSEIK